MFKLKRSNGLAGWFGFKKWEVVLEEYNLIVGAIAKNKGWRRDGRKGWYYTAYYPDGEKKEYVFKEFLKFREAKNWLLNQLSKEWYEKLRGGIYEVGKHKHDE